MKTKDDCMDDFLLFLKHDINSIEKIIKENNRIFSTSYSSEKFLVRLNDIECGILEEVNNITKAIVYDGDPITTILLMIVETLCNNTVYLCTDSSMDFVNKYLLEIYNTFCEKSEIKNNIHFFKYDNDMQLDKYLKHVHYDFLVNYFDSDV